MPQPHTSLPDSTATRFVAVPRAFERDARLVVLDPGELVFTHTSGASSRSDRRRRATRGAGSRRSDLGSDRRTRCDFDDHGRMTASTSISPWIPRPRGARPAALCSRRIEDQQEVPNV